MKRIISLALAIVLFATSFAFADSVKTEAEKTFQDVLLNGEKIELGAYLINQRNYVKLRDVAAVLANTDAKFNVGFDRETKKVLITTGEAYEKLDTDLVALPEGKQVAVIDERDFVFNGEEKDVETAVINSNNFLQLRQLGELIGFNVNYNEVTKDIELSTVAQTKEEAKAEDKKDEKVEEKKEEVVEPFTNLSEKKELKAEEQEKLVKAITEKVALDKENGTIKNITLNKVTEGKDDNKTEVKYEGKVTTDKKAFEFEVKFEGEKVDVELEEVKTVKEEIKEKVNEVKEEVKEKVEEIKEDAKKVVDTIKKEVKEKVEEIKK